MEKNNTYLMVEDPEATASGVFRGHSAMPPGVEHLMFFLQKLYVHS